ncbi:hypothetical protein ACFQ3S_04245 [Mucilaginibacter terrae]|uniref:hypothetical protein n=1 Tax=Mucilaginibacter terrae TaxID=1955052 RepID=UPI00362D09C4
MKLLELKKNVKRNLKLIFINSKVIKDNNKINDKKMRDIADQLKTDLPGCGFALLAFDIHNNETCANYVSNVEDDYMIHALEMQLNILKNKKSAKIISVLKSGSN